MGDKELEKIVYQLGVRDGWAIVLMEYWKDKKEKLPYLAALYKEKFGDHPSLTFHLS